MSTSHRKRSIRCYRVRVLAQAALFLISSLYAANSLSAQPRVALVIGNNSYLRISQLDNAVNDAISIAQELRKSGFQIISVVDGKAENINEAKHRFLKAIANGGIGVFFFSGHGVQVEGRNYLLPVDFSARSLDGLAREGISVPNILDEIDSAKPKLNIVILDSCRDNPFVATDSGLASARGLSEVARPIPTGTLVLYAASSNQTALDALPGPRSANGLFTGELLAAMQEPSLEIRDLAQKVRYSVMEKALSVGHLQVPALYDNLSPGAFYLSRPPAQRPFQASGSLPQKIKIIIPFAAQGPSDGVIRAMAPFLSRALGREIVLENQIDIQGERVAALIADGPTDGSVLLVSPYASAARRFAVNDVRLMSLGIFADTPLSLVVNSKNHAKNLSDLVAATMAAKRRLRMTVPLRGSVAEMCGQQAQKKLGMIDLASVNGEAIAISEVINGTADFTCASAASVRSMASQSNSPIREIAEVRSTASPFARKLQVESTGAQGFDIVAPNWLGLFASSRLNADLARSLSAAVARLQEDPAYAQAISRFQALPVSAEQATPDGLTRMLQLAISLQK
jgi:tripartite-type tricarboxylate transporter receptor subunit TctC